MFNCLFWMFKQQDFKKHFFYLLSTYIFFLASALLVFFIASSFVSSLVWQISLYVIAGILFVCPFLCFQGYFWCLADNIIFRGTDIVSSNIYNGKVKEVYKIDLPEISTPRFIWRGIASIVASLLLCYPFAIVLTLMALTSGAVVMFYNLDVVSTIFMYLFFYVFLSLFIPALLWNYAKQDSIFAVWNFPKAIHIMGTYFGKYIWNTFLFIVFAFVNSCITTFLSFILGLSNLQNNLSFDTFTIIRVVIFFAIQFAIAIYWIFVNAYLLGTIAPSNEA